MSERPLPGEAAARPAGLPDPAEALDSPTAGGRVIRGGALRTGAYVAGIALGIVSASLMTRHLGVEDFGKYIIVTSLVAIVAGLTDIGMTTVAAREFATRERADRDRLMTNLLGVRLAIAVGGVLGATVFALAAGYESAMVVGTLLAGVGLLLATVQQTFAIPIGVALRFAWLSGLDLLRQVLFVVTIVSLVLVGADLLPFLAATIPVGAVMLVAAIPLVRGAIPLLPAFDLREWGRIARLTGAYALASAVGTLYASAAVVTTSFVGSESESGFLGAAFRIYSVASAVPVLLITSTFPVLARAAHADRDRLEYALQRIFEVALILGVWMAIGLALGAEVAIDIVAGEDFEGAVPALQVQGAVLAVAFIALAGGFALVSLRAHLTLLVGSAAAFTTVVVGTVLLVPARGAEGAAVAMLLAESVVAIVYWADLVGRRGFRLELGVVPRVAVAAGLALALVLTPIEGVLLVLAASIVYGAALFVLGGIPREAFEAFGAARRDPD